MYSSPSMDTNSVQSSTRPTLVHSCLRASSSRETLILSDEEPALHIVIQPTPAAAKEQGIEAYATLQEAMRAFESTPSYVETNLHTFAAESAEQTVHILHALATRSGGDDLKQVEVQA